MAKLKKKIDEINVEKIWKLSQYLSRKVAHLNFTLLPYCSPIKNHINNKMVTAIFKVSKFTGNSFIYCSLTLNNIKRTYAIKSLRTREGEISGI